MLTITKIKRSYIIDHVMPSDLDKNDLKHGLYLKEKMISEMTDDYVKSIIPDWEEIEKNYRDRGLSDYMDKIMCGEMSYDDLTQYNPVKTKCFLRWKKFNDSFDDENNMYDFDLMNGYCQWIEKDKEDSFEIQNNSDVMIQLLLAIIGDNAGRYYPLQDESHASGFEYVDDVLKIYDCSVWDRVSDTDNHLQKPVKDQKEFYRMFFKNRVGYSEFNWFKEDEFIKEKYSGQEVRTLLSDPIRVCLDIKLTENKGQYDPKYVQDTLYGIISGKQWIKTKYITEMISVSNYKIRLNCLDKEKEN